MTSRRNLAPGVDRARPHLANGDELMNDASDATPATAPTYADTVTRTLSDFEHWAYGIEATVTFHYPDAPDETQRVRISAHIEHGRYVWTLRAWHGPTATGTPAIVTPVHPDVIKRIRATSGTFDLIGMPTRAFLTAFYAN